MQQQLWVFSYVEVLQNEGLDGRLLLTINHMHLVLLHFTVKTLQLTGSSLLPYSFLHTKEMYEFTRILHFC